MTINHIGMDYIGEKLKALRKSKGWTQVQLAKQLGIVAGTISSYETGLKHPSVEMLIEISRTFGTSVDFILGLTDQMTPLALFGLTDVQMAPFLQLVAEMMQYNALLEQQETEKTNNDLNKN